MRQQLALLAQDDVQRNANAERFVRTLKAQLPNSVQIQRRGWIFFGRFSGARIQIGEQVFRLRIVGGALTAEVAQTQNGVALSHTAVPLAQWAGLLRAALDGLAGRGGESDLFGSLS